MKFIYFASVLILFFIWKMNAEEAPKHPFPANIVKQARKVQTYCQKQTNVTDELIIKSRSNIFPDDAKLRCFLHCMFDISGIMNSENEISLEPIKNFLPDEFHELIDHMEQNCGTQAGADSCEIAYNTMLCYVKYNTREYPMIL